MRQCLRQKHLSQTDLIRSAIKSFSNMIKLLLHQYHKILALCNIKGELASSFSLNTVCSQYFVVTDAITKITGYARKRRIRVIFQAEKYLQHVIYYVPIYKGQFCSRSPSVYYLSSSPAGTLFAGVSHSVRRRYTARRWVPLMSMLGTQFAGTPSTWYQPASSVPTGEHCGISRRTMRYSSANTVVFTDEHCGIHRRSVYLVCLLSREKTTNIGFRHGQLS